MKEKSLNTHNEIYVQLIAALIGYIIPTLISGGFFFGGINYLFFERQNEINQIEKDSLTLTNIDNIDFENRIEMIDEVILDGWLLREIPLELHIIRETLNQNINNPQLPLEPNFLQETEGWIIQTQLDLADEKAIISGQSFSGEREIKFSQTLLQMYDLLDQQMWEYKELVDGWYSESIEQKIQWLDNILNIQMDLQNLSQTLEVISNEYYQFFGRKQIEMEQDFKVLRGRYDAVNSKTFFSTLGLFAGLIGILIIAVYLLKKNSKANHSKKSTRLELYQQIALTHDVPQANLYEGDVAVLLEFLEHPSSGEQSAVLEVFNVLGESINVVTVPVSAIASLTSDQLPSVRTRAG